MSSLFLGSTPSLADIGPEAPDWLHGVLTDHVYKMEAEMERLHKRLDAQAEQSQHQQSKVRDVLVQMTDIAHGLAEEHKRGEGRDQDIKSFRETLVRMKFAAQGGSEIGSTTESSVERQIRNLRTDLDAALESNFAEMNTDLERQLHGLQNVLADMSAEMKKLQKEVGRLQQEDRRLELKQGIQGLSTSIVTMKCLHLHEAQRHELMKAFEEHKEALEREVDELGEHGPQRERTSVWPQHSGGDAEHHNVGGDEGVDTEAVLSMVLGQHRHPGMPAFAKLMTQHLPASAASATLRKFSTGIRSGTFHDATFHDGDEEPKPARRSKGLLWMCHRTPKEEAEEVPNGAGK